MILQVGVKVLLKNPEDKYLLLKRNLDKYPDVKKDSVWDIPGGRIDPERGLLENLKREVLEETGMQLESDIKLIAAQDILRPDKHVVRLTYIASIDGSPKLSDEHIDFKWLTVDELHSIDGLDSFIKEILILL